MSSSPPSASKVSDVLDVPSEEPKDSLDCITVSAVYSLAVDREKQVFTDAVNYCMTLLKQSNRLTSEKSDVLSLEATLMGHEMFQRIIGINVQMDVKTEKEVLGYSGQENLETQEIEVLYSEKPPRSENVQMTIKQENMEDDYPTITTPDELTAILQENRPPRFTRSIGPTFVQIPHETIQDFLRYAENEEKQLPPSPVSLSGSDYSMDQSSKTKQGSNSSHLNVIPLELKQRVVTLMRENPDWSFQKLRKEARIPNLRSTAQVKTWEKQVDGGGTRFDKYNKINDLTYQRFRAAQEKSQSVTADMMRKWALEAARDVYGPNFQFRATLHWATNFRKRYNLKWNNATNAYFEEKKKEVAKPKGKQVAKPKGKGVAKPKEKEVAKPKEKSRTLRSRGQKTSSGPQ